MYLAGEAPKPSTSSEPDLLDVTDPVRKIAAREMALITGLPAPAPAPQPTMTPKLEQEGKYTGLRELD